MNSIAHAIGTAASPTSARVTSIEEGRADHDHSYFFRMPDWLADELCARHASGAAWALVTLVGRKTRWGACAPQRITLQEMIETTHYSRQALVNALAALASSGVLYEEREPKAVAPWDMAGAASATMAAPDENDSATPRKATRSPRKKSVATAKTNSSRKTPAQKKSAAKRR